MQGKINNKVQFGQTLNPPKNVAKVSNINNTSDLQDAFTKIDKLNKLWDDGSMDDNKDKSIVYTYKEYMPLLAELI